MPAHGKPGFSPDAVREIVEQQREANEAQRRGELALARRYRRSPEYHKERKVVYDLYLQGFTPQEIRTEAWPILGYDLSLQKVDAFIKSAIHDQKRYSTEERRAVENARMDFLLVALKDRISLGDDKAIGRAIEISKRRAALNGLDAPVRVQAQITADVDPALLAMAEEARAQAQQAISNAFPQGIEDAELAEDPDEIEGTEGGYADVDFAADVPEEEL